MRVCQKIQDSPKKLELRKSKEISENAAATEEPEGKTAGTGQSKGKPGRQIAASKAGSEVAGQQVCGVGMVGLIGSLSAQMRWDCQDRLLVFLEWKTTKAPHSPITTL